MHFLENQHFLNTEITGYKVDGKSVPLQGVGSIIRFDGPDEGLLHRAGKTIAAAVYLENAAVNYAKEPVLTKLDFWAIAANEVYMACRKSGMDEGTALAFAMERSSTHLMTHPKNPSTPIKTQEMHSIAY